jgi:4-hydroxy-tetrahydrodipicolinate synthase
MSVERNFFLEGVCPVVETPFTADERIDVDSFDALVSSLHGAGVKAVMFPGFASEFFKLDPSEKNELVSVLLEAKGNLDGLSVVLSVAQHSTAKAVEEVESLVTRGADAINLLPSYFSDPHPRHRRQHIEAVLDAAGHTPVILQYAPHQTGTSMSINDFADLAQGYGNFRQVKVESTPPGSLISQLADANPSISSIVGYAGVQMIDAMGRGAVAVQPGSSFVEIYLDIWNLWSEGKVEASRELHTRLLPYISYWMQSVELIVQAEKTISFRRGLTATDTCRRPGRPLDDAEITLIDKFFTEFESYF